ncbi:MAG: hypothetical protein ACK4GQ_04395 [Candidatus Hadarchaeales archaeon]
MREEYLEYSLWLLIIGSWVAGMAYGKWGGGASGIFSEIGQTVGLPPPVQLAWWQPLLYFPLTVLAAFILSQLFFGGGAIIFIFSRGVIDSTLLENLENLLARWNILTLEAATIWTIFFIILVLAVNLPLCLWASHLGTKRSFRMLQRLRGNPLKPESGIWGGLLLLVTVSLVAGLIGSFALSYAA